MYVTRFCIFDQLYYYQRNDDPARFYFCINIIGARSKLLDNSGINKKVRFDVRRMHLTFLVFRT